LNPRFDGSDLARTLEPPYHILARMAREPLNFFQRLVARLKRQSLANARGRAWESGPKRIDQEYSRRGGGSGSLDLYFGEPGEPLLVFAHIPKTAGTALRNIIHSNLGETCEVVEIPRRTTRREDLLEWYSKVYESLGDRRDRLICVASHSAQYLPAVVSDREIRSFTVLRDPVDRSLSRYYFLSKPESTVDDMYASFARAAENGGRASRKEIEFANGQSRRLLAPYFDSDQIPRSAGDPESDLWRQRLFTIVEEQYLVGLQERFPESIELFAREFGWAKVYDASAKVNRARPSLSEVPMETRDLIRSFNWLDEELYRACSERFDSVLKRRPGSARAGSTTTG
jgi:hypothetical protein